jgi:type III restriction enzyme
LCRNLTDPTLTQESKRAFVAAPSRDYDDSKEDFECAVWLDQQADRGRIDFWVRNLVRREGSSFSLQKSDGKFYPDFACKLPADGPILVVEYKGGDKWNTPKVEMDRQVGDLWVNGVRVKQALF